jgi:hypothetical protein
MDVDEESVVLLPRAQASQGNLEKLAVFALFLPAMSVKL